jgi:hypothetical protein
MESSANPSVSRKQPVILLAGGSRTILRDYNIESRAVPVSRYHNSPREYPDALYVSVPAITKGVSAFIGLICVVSLVMMALTGFTLINPLFAVLFIFFSAGFYLMGEMLHRKKSRR